MEIITKNLVIENVEIPNHRITSDGRIFRVYKDGKTRELKRVMVGKYAYVNISIEGQNKMLSVNKLVMYTFSDMFWKYIKYGQIVNKDSDFNNLSIDNLELKRNKYGKIIHQPRFIKNRDTGEIKTVSELSKLYGLDGAYISTYVNRNLPIKGSIWEDVPEAYLE